MLTPDLEIFTSASEISCVAHDAATDDMDKYAKLWYPSIEEKH